MKEVEMTRQHMYSVKAYEENEKKTIEVEYEANNSGGFWWLSDKDWFNLEMAGWTIMWRDFLGSVAQIATKRFSAIKEAISEFEEITGLDADEEGCPCCDPPHEFNWVDEQGERQSVAGNEIIEIRRGSY